MGLQDTAKRLARGGNLALKDWRAQPRRGTSPRATLRNTWDGQGSDRAWEGARCGRDRTACSGREPTQVSNLRYRKLTESPRPTLECRSVEGVRALRRRETLRQSDKAEEARVIRELRRACRTLVRQARDAFSCSQPGTSPRAWLPTPGCPRGPNLKSPLTATGLARRLQSYAGVKNRHVPMFSPLLGSSSSSSS